MSDVSVSEASFGESGPSYTTSSNYCRAEGQNLRVRLIAFTYTRISAEEHGFMDTSVVHTMNTRFLSSLAEYIYCDACGDSLIHFQACAVGPDGAMLCGTSGMRPVSAPPLDEPLLAFPPDENTQYCAGRLDQSFRTHHEEQGTS